jgi:hypothetical protein
MKYVKMEDCWMVLDTGERIPFGEIIVDMYNFDRKKFNDYNNEYFEILDKYGSKSPELSAYNEKNSFFANDDYYKSVEYFLSVLDFYFSGELEEGENGKFQIRKSSKLTPDEQLRQQQEYIKRAKNQGWLDIADDTYISLIDKQFLPDENNESFPSISVTPHLINHKWYPAYDIPDDGGWATILAFWDLMEIRNHNIPFSCCSHCNNIYIKRKHNSKYCSKCSSNYKAIQDKKRQSTPRGLHHKVYTYMRNSYKFSDNEINAFQDESDYYWSLLNGKNPINEHHYQTDIHTENDYILWLNQKHDEFKQQAKTRGKKY